MKVQGPSTSNIHSRHVFPKPDGHWELPTHKTTIPDRSGQANVKRIIFCKDCNKDSRDLTRALHNPLVLGATCSKVGWLHIIMQVQEQ